MGKGRGGRSLYLTQGAASTGPYLPHLNPRLPTTTPGEKPCLRRTVKARLSHGSRDRRRGGEVGLYTSHMGLPPPAPTSNGPYLHHPRLPAATPGEKPTMDSDSKTEPWIKGWGREVGLYTSHRELSPPVPTSPTSTPASQPPPQEKSRAYDGQ